MQNYFGVFRDGEYMKKGREELNALRERIARIVIGDKSKAFNTARLEALELQNLFEVAEATAIAADERTESRGAHSRVDHIERDDSNWLKHSFAFKNGDSVKLDYKDVELGNYEPKERKY